jgi:CheY-like chemotaxis protein
LSTKRSMRLKERKAMPKKILIIDDDPVIVKYLTAVFSDNGYATCSATSSMEGLDIVKKEKPDLICLDLQMPGEWGPRFYRKLRKDKEVRNTPVIVVSGIDGDHAIKDAVAFVKKPFDPEKLIGIVKNTIG